MRILILLVVILPMLVTLAGAASYSCRDSSGRQHLADSLANLPEECRGDAQTHKPADALGGLNVVPATEVPAGTSERFQQSVQEAEREEREKQQRVAPYRKEAESLVARYERAIETRRKSQLKWTYRTRREYDDAIKEIEQVQDEKQQLLQKFPELNLTPAQEAEVEQILKTIKDR